MKGNKKAELIFLQLTSHEISTDLSIDCSNNVRIQKRGGNRIQHLQRTDLSNSHRNFPPRISNIG